MSLLLRRMPNQKFRSEEWQENMGKINNCTECGACAKRCPYGLDTPNLLKKHLKNYTKWLESVNS